MSHSPTVRRIVGPTILLQSGVYFDFLDPASSSFTLGDVAHALSMICRFAGHCKQFYSVAEHSVHVSRAVPSEYALIGLLHDAAEAFIGDISKPLKDLLPDYRTLEAKIEACVLGRFGVSLPLPKAVKEIDIAMLATEQRQLMQNRDDWDYTRGRQPLPIFIECWRPEEAKRRFLARFDEIELDGAEA